MRKIILITLFFTLFLDFFNLGLIYPLFTSLIFEGSGSLFYKNALFGLLISAFPFGQFLGAPIIGLLSDQQGRRKLLLLTLCGTAAALFFCAMAVWVSSLTLLVLSRFAGGLMAGNLTLAYAALADFSRETEKVKNFALIPLATGLGFSFGPYAAGLLSNPDSFPIAGPALPFFAAALLTLINFALVLWRFPETIAPKGKAKLWNGYLKSFKNFGANFMEPTLIILFLMLSANLLFVQFVGPLAIERFSFSVTEVGYLYANIGLALAFGHTFITRRLADYFLPETALKGGLLLLSALLIGLLFVNGALLLHLLTFSIMIACAIAYTNAMALISNRAALEKQGEIMGAAVSVQSLAEFLPALLLGLVAALSQALPLLMAACFAALALILLNQRLAQVVE